MLGSAAAKQDSITQGIDLQPIIDRAEENSTIVLKSGVYLGPVVITKPLTIGGNGRAIIDGQKKGTVITIKANGVRLKDLKVMNTGDRHDLIDAAVSLIDSSNCEISSIRTENCLFGINLQNSHNNIIKGNHITSKPYELGLRGDAIWVWWSDSNIFTGNKIMNARDFVVWYSMGNIIEKM